MNELSSIVEQNTQTYNALAAEYEQKVRQRKEYNRGVIERLLPYLSKTSKRVLDVGCAVGLDMALFQEFGFETDGIEVSPEMVGFAQARNPTSVIYAGDFLETSFVHTYDVIWANAYIHLYPSHEVPRVLKKMRSLIVQGGFAHITTTKHTESKEGWFVKSDYAGARARFRKYWTEDELKTALQQAGFETVHSYQIVCPFGKEWFVHYARNPVITSSPRA